MIPFGPGKAKTIELDGGEFNCPNCRAKTGFRRYEVVRTRRLWFLRFQGETLDNYIVCTRCERRMRDEDLRGRMPADTRALLTAIEQQLSTGIPIEEALGALMSEGMGEVDARRIVNAAAGIVLKKCRQCALTYVNAVHSCKKCGHILPTG